MPLSDSSQTPAWQQASRAHLSVLQARAYAGRACCSLMAPRVVQAIQQLWNKLDGAKANQPEWLAAAEGVRGQVARLIKGQVKQIALH